MLDSRESNGFIVHLPYGPLPWMAILLNLNLVKSEGDMGEQPDIYT